VKEAHVPHPSKARTESFDPGVKGFGGGAPDI